MSATASAAPAHGHELEQSKFWIFVQIAMLLAVITGLELVTVYLPFMKWLLVSALVILSTVKFMFVIFYFMHLRWDKAFCTILFFIGLILGGRNDVGAPEALRGRGEQAAPGDDARPAGGGHAGCLKAGRPGAIRVPTMIDWRHWHNEPFLTGGLILAGWLYAILAGPLRPLLAPGRPYPRGRAALFYAALVLFYLAVGSPLDQVAERFLLSAHMAQHLLIMYPVPLLHPARDAVLDGGPGALKAGPRAPRCGLLLSPVACAVLSTAVISLWHAPFLYEWTLQDKLVHVAEHLMFLAVSFLYWWPLASPSRPSRRPATASGCSMSSRRRSP